jgi:hypothetical protein
MGFEARVEEPEALADPAVETADWTRPVTPDQPAAPGPVWFVDGVRRVELRVQGSDGAVRAPGLFGSFAVGAVRCDGRATFEDHRVGRRVVVGGGLPVTAAEVRTRHAVLRYEALSEPTSDPAAPLDRLQDAMRAEENALAAHVAARPDGDALVIVDGPLRLGDAVSGPIVGAVKRFVRRYLDLEQDQLIGRLSAGQRTPVFGLLDAERERRGFSWYARVADLRGPWHDHAGVLRCEVRAAIGLDAAVALADRVTALLPRFAGRAADPRTPQNLVPISGLEAWLRHRMGDARMIRRALLGMLGADEERHVVGMADDG